MAYELARRGASVQIVDERAVGMGATQASAGMLAPYIETRDDSPLFALTVRSLGLYDDFVARVASDSAMTVTYRRTGTLEVATDESAMRELRATADGIAPAWRRRRDAGPAGGAAGRTGLATDVVGGLLIGTHGFVSATELTRAASAAARRARRPARGAQPRHTDRAGPTADIEVETDRGVAARRRRRAGGGQLVGVD